MEDNSGGESFPDSGPHSFIYNSSRQQSDLNNGLNQAEVDPLHQMSVQDVNQPPDGARVDVGHLTLDTTSVTLQEPDYSQMREDRLLRTRTSMKAVDAGLVSKIIPAPERNQASREDIAAIKIQSCFRGYLDRKQYLQRLYEFFEKEEAMRLEKQRQQMEEGELLVANHRLQVQLEDNHTTRQNRARLYSTQIITIQRAWRHFKRRCTEWGNNNNIMPPSTAWDTDDLSESESVTAGNQAMSLSTPDSDRYLVDDDESQSDDNVENLDNDRNTAEIRIQTSVTDYSEMADPLKEHLANVCVIPTTDRTVTNETKVTKMNKQNNKIMRSPDETDEQFNKRLRKINYLSLAQEFAALKQVDADALPFDLHNHAQNEHLQDASPMSEASSEAGSELSLTDSSTNTPIDVNAKEFPDDGGPPVPERVDSLNKSLASVPPKKEAWASTPPPTGPDKQYSQNSSEQSKNAQSINSTSVNSRGRSLGNPFINEPPQDCTDSSEPDSESQPLFGTGSTANQLATGDTTESSRMAAHSPSNASDKQLDDFDVYNIESTLPSMNWDLLEEQLQRAAEEENRKRSRRTDREEIRRRLAMGVDEEYYGGERALRKPSLQTRLQGAMNLQICFMNELTEQENGTDANQDNKNNSTNQPKQLQPAVCEVVVGTPKPARSGNNTGKKPEEEDEDFFAKQAKLQDEARMALAQVRPMAHMQLEVEKQLRKKSPIAEIVGIPNLSTRKQFHPKLMYEMNIAQLQVVVNDLHSQIESLNEELVMLLVQRDDLHMEQDSMLVDIEDLTRRAQEIAAKVNQKPSNKPVKKVIKKK